jgi:hypothetical protein
MRAEATERRLLRALPEEFVAATVSALSDMTVSISKRVLVRGCQIRLPLCTKRYGRSARKK